MDKLFFKSIVIDVILDKKWLIKVIVVIFGVALYISSSITFVIYSVTEQIIFVQLHLRIILLGFRVEN